MESAYQPQYTVAHYGDGGQPGYTDQTAYHGAQAGYNSQHTGYGPQSPGVYGEIPANNAGYAQQHTQGTYAELPVNNAGQVDRSSFSSYGDNTNRSSIPAYDDQNYNYNYAAQADPIKQHPAVNPKPLRKGHFYIPPVLRLPSLLIVFLITVALLGAVEYGVQKLPHKEKNKHADPAAFVSSVVSQAKSVASSIVKRAPQTTVIPAQTTTVPSESAGGTSAVPRSSYVTTTTSEQGTIVGTVPPSSYATAPPTSYAPTAPPNSYVTSTVASGSYVGGGTSSVAKDSYVTASASLTSGSYVGIPSVAQSSYVTTQRLTTQIPTTQVTSVASTIISTNAAGQATTLVTYVPTTSTGLATVETSVATLVGAGTNVKGQNGNEPFPRWQVFVGNSYLALLVAVIFKQFWTAISSQARLIEPFAQMNTDAGATAKSVLSSFYLSSSLIPEPILALMKGQWFILATSTVYLAVGLLAPLGSELVWLDTNYTPCPNPVNTVKVNNINNPCWPPRLSIDPVLARVTEGLLTFTAVMTLTIMFMMWRIRTGVYSDPSSLATVAALTHHPEVLQDFRAISDEASSKDIALLLENKRYKLDEYMRPDGTWRYGIVPAHGMGAVHHYTPVDEKRAVQEAKPKHRAWRTIDLILDILFIVCLLALLGIVVAYYKDGNLEDPFNKFFNTMSFGPRFVLTATGSLFALNWKRLERDAHTLSPFHSMAQAPADPLRTILLRKSSVPLTSIFPMLFKSHYFASFIACIAVLAELLVIFLGAVPFAPGQFYEELLMACYTSMALLGLMVVSVVIMIIWKRRMPDLPRAPDTVSAVMTYVADSRMLDDFEGAEYCDDNELRNRIGGRGKRYVYGKRPGSDGQSRYLVDEESTLVYS
ncbi:hypothetical protein BT63DRAFT_435720 [Microthyrium microscopicum]|uniref:Uncharacterized protein n=1 Tax=Microthyrium microscopicum TaxID=703497 RepID=A0A6A6USB2_9PEZI|nr:hypothetical protein BT63DRAFT_435720 [Microthyrium microscopicum]